MQNVCWLRFSAKLNFKWEKKKFSQKIFWMKQNWEKKFCLEIFSTNICQEIWTWENFSWIVWPDQEKFLLNDLRILTNDKFSKSSYCLNRKLDNLNCSLFLGIISVWIEKVQFFNFLPFFRINWNRLINLKFLIPASLDFKWFNLSRILV